MSWRDHLPVHPAADLFPLMSESELRELGEDIKKNGLLEQPMFYRDPELGIFVLDGRNRLDACELIGRETVYASGEPVGTIRDGSKSFDPFAFVVSKNIRRRHLTAEQRQELLITLIARKPELSNRQIAKKVGVTDKTIATARAKGEQLRRIPQLEKTTGADGKQRKSRAKKAPKPEPKPDSVTEPHVTESPEINIEQRQADMARLDEPAVETVDEVDRRVSCVANTILRHVEDLPRSDAERFFAALRDRIDEIEREELRDAAVAEVAS